MQNDRRDWGPLGGSIQGSRIAQNGHNWPKYHFFCSYPTLSVNKFSFLINWSNAGREAENDGESRPPGALSRGFEWPKMVSPKKVECIPPFFVFQRNRVSPFLMGKLSTSTGCTPLWTKLIFKLILTILFPTALTRALLDKYFLSYDFLKIKIFRDFLLFFSLFLLWLREQF